MNELTQQIKNFGIFLKLLTISEQVEISPVQDNDTCLTGTIKSSAKKIRNTLISILDQKPKCSNKNQVRIWSFKIKSKGWIIIEEYEDVSFLTLQNKWWK